MRAGGGDGPGSGFADEGREETVVVWNGTVGRIRELDACPEATDAAPAAAGDGDPPASRGGVPSRR